MTTPLVNTINSIGEVIKKTETVRVTSSQYYYNAAKMTLTKGKWIVLSTGKYSVGTLLRIGFIQSGCTFNGGAYTQVHSGNIIMAVGFVNTSSNKDVSIHTYGYARTYDITFTNYAIRIG